jgi:hypothetical protein
MILAIEESKRGWKFKMEAITSFHKQWYLLCFEHFILFQAIASNYNDAYARVCCCVLCRRVAASPLPAPGG